MNATREESPARVKAHCNRAHARTRALERHGLDLDDAALVAIEGRIRAGDPDCVPVTPEDYAGRPRPLYAIRIDDRWIPVLYDKSTASVISFLPEHALDKWRAAIEPVAIEPDPPPPPAPPPRVPYYGEILGHVELKDPRYAGDAILDALPPVREVGPGPATRDDLLLVLCTIEARRDEAMSLMARSVRKTAARAAIVAEVARLDDLARDLKRRRHEILVRIEGEPAIADDPPSPSSVDLMEALFVVARSLARRVGWQVEACEVATLDAAKAFLEKHARATAQPERTP